MADVAEAEDGRPVHVEVPAMPSSIHCIQLLIIDLHLSFNSKYRLTLNNAWITENEKHETSKREKSEKTSVSANKISSEEEKKRKKFVPFQYYATTGEADDEPSQLESESANSTWDQKMEEVQHDSDYSDNII